jgi:hypothetical protein
MLDRDDALPDLDACARPAGDELSQTARFVGLRRPTRAA